MYEKLIDRKLGKTNENENKPYFIDNKNNLKEKEKNPLNGRQIISKKF